MSSQADAESAAIVDLYKSLFTASCFQFAASALVLFDFFVTLDEEVRLFWKRKLSGASVLFFIVRYWALFNYELLVFIGYASFSDADSPCTAFSIAHSSDCHSHQLRFIREAALCRTIFSVHSLGSTAFSSLRVLALSGLNYPLAVLVFLLSVGPAVVNFTVFHYGITGQNVLTIGCQGGSSVPRQPAQMTSLIAADILVIVITIATTRRRGTPHLGRPGKATLGDVLLYDGIKYFAVLLTLNILQVVLTHLSIKIISQQGSYIAQISDPLTAIFISRFLLDLQSANQASRALGTQTLGSFPVGSMPAQEGTLRFTSRVIGSLGGSAQPGSELEFGSSTDELDYGSEDVMSEPVDLKAGGESSSDQSSSLPELKTGLGESVDHTGSEPPQEVAFESGHLV
ncbi:hypothetical protein C8Q78DRAFT_1075089 [Trametes maxima]|nr:hypothetical protein C8Q78DRAFT_1075089 [Trametes maxima]